MLHAANPTYVFSTLAGSPGQAGSQDGSGEEARFADLYHLAIDSLGNIYVADGSNHTIRKITSDGAVSTFAGMAGQPGSVDGMGAAARFRSPKGVAVDNAGNVYVADTGNSTIRKITPAQEVTTLAGTAVPDIGSGSADGVGAAAGFFSPHALVVDSLGFIYVADTFNHTIRKITPVGVVSTLAGVALQTGRADGAGNSARFNQPTGITIDAAGNLYVADVYHYSIRKITPDAVVTTVPWNTGETVSFVVDESGPKYVAGIGSHTVWKLADGALSGVGAMGEPGSADGPENMVRFNRPTGIAMDAEGVLYVTDRGNRTIRKGVPVRVNWSEPAPIPHGSAYSDAQRTATANVPGTFVYSFVNGTVPAIGSHPLSATFTPTGGSTRTETTVTTTLVVTNNAAVTPMIAWQTPAAISYGTALSTQLNATANVPGSFEYVPAAGTVLGPGNHTLRVTFTPTDLVNYVATTAQVSLSVNGGMPPPSSGEIVYLGGYFGTFTRGGTWALFAGTPSKFIAYLPWRKSAIVQL